jgi:stalled ribosome rescue protein Dom34
MAAAILFIDSDHAKIFKLEVGKIDTKAMKKHEIQHHLTADKNNEEHEKHFFSEVTQELNEVTQLLVVGPGFAKNRFKTYVETHHHETLAKGIVGLETVDHPTDPEVLAIGRKFFKDYDLFH